MCEKDEEHSKFLSKHQEYHALDHECGVLGQHSVVLGDALDALSEMVAVSS